MFNGNKTSKNWPSGNSANGKSALITGASSGIGLELARLFAKDGFNLILVGRNRENLESLAQELFAAHQVQTTVVVQDLVDPSAPNAILEQLSRNATEIDVLVNNAGTQVYGEFINADLDQLLAMIQVNSTTMVNLTHLILPGMLRRGWGRILNLGSTGSFAPGPLNAVYCATKAFVLSFSIAIGAELAGTGVTVSALCPGATETQFITRHGMRDVRLFRNTMLPARVAQIGFRALKQSRPVVVAGLRNQLEVLFYQLMAPLLPFTPPARLMAIGRRYMGRNDEAGR